MALGSTIGHTLGAGITSLFMGSQSRSGEIDGDQQNHYAAPEKSRVVPEASNPCDKHNQAFLKCIESHSSDIAPCQFYLDAMKQCMSNAETKLYN